MTGSQSHLGGGRVSAAPPSVSKASRSKRASDLGTALDAIPDAFFLLDASGEVRSANAWAAEFCGCPGDRLAGAQLVDLLPASARATVQSALDRAVRGTPQSFDVGSSGDHTWFAGHAYPSSGGVMLHLHNVTERRNTEDVLTFLAEAGTVLSGVHEEVALFTGVGNLVVPRLADWCLIVLHSGTRTVNFDAVATQPALRERVLGLADRACLRRSPDRSDVMGIEGPVVLSPTDATGPFAKSPLWSLATSMLLVPLSGLGANQDILIMGRGATSIPFGTFDLRLTEPLAMRVRLVLEKVRMFEAEQRATQLRDDVLAIVAHDLRSPLNSLVLGATALTQMEGTTDLQQAARHAVLTAADQMNDLLDDLLNAAQLDAGWAPRHRERVPVSHLIEQAVELFQWRAAKDGVQLDVVLDAVDDVYVDVDAGRMGEVLSNLLDNAFKFTPRGGRVSVAATVASHRVQLTVRDTGRGIEPDAIPRLFDRFWQARKNGRAGAGLGLFIARRVVDGHGGRIWAQSQMGEGSQFHILLSLSGAVNPDASGRGTGSEQP